MNKIKLSVLKNNLEGQSEDSSTYYNVKTGETYFYAGDEWSDDDPDMIEKIEDDDDYITMPSKFDINEYDIMQDFVDALPEGKMQSKLENAIVGKGAFRRFRDTLNDYHLEEKWYHYRDGALEKIGRDWAEDNDLEVVEDVPSDLHYLDMEKDETIHKILLVIDMQNDFIDGSLGTKEAQAIVPSVIKKIKSYPKENVYATRDTHPADYLKTQEGKYLPVEHCIKGTKGWQLQKDIASLVYKDHIYDKPTFGSVDLAREMSDLNDQEKIEIEIIGLCTDICVVSNALLLKAVMPQVKISVDPSCCAGVTPAKHLAALETMKSCQIQGIE